MQLILEQNIAVRLYHFVTENWWMFWTRWRAEGGERGEGLGHPRQVGIERVKSQK